MFHIIYSNSKGYFMVLLSCTRECNPGTRKPR